MFSDCANFALFAHFYRSCCFNLVSTVAMDRNLINSSVRLNNNM